MANNNNKPEFPLTPELSNFTFELAKEIGIDTKLKQGFQKAKENELDALTKSESGNLTNNQ